MTTICMHGSPLSRHDNRDLWHSYDYRSYGIIAEPYFDIDFNRVFYATDTGRSWKNTSASIRDRVETKFTIPINSTRHFIERIDQQQLPRQLMITLHPQRWHDHRLPWTAELLGQTAKNVIKRGLAKVQRR